MKSHAGQAAAPSAGGDAPSAKQSLSEKMYGGAAKKQLSLQWNLSLMTKEVKTNANGQKAMSTKVILDNVAGDVKSGEMLALMGASGAGKSSLLDCISLRNQRFKGQVMVDNVPVNQHFFGFTAYVYQDDLFFPTLTVREHLKFHAMVRMPKSVPYIGKLEKVEEIIRDVGLVSCGDSLIGGANSLVRGVSGGERKRVAVATELLSDPQIMFLDEPTSGLDAFMAESVCTLLRKLTNKGKVVICVIHQPSSDTFNLFTNLCLLAKGRVAYFGSRAEAVHYFAAQGMPCPSNFNPADFFIDELAVIPSELEKSLAKVRKVADFYQNSELRKRNDAWLSKYDPELFNKKWKPLKVGITNYNADSYTQFCESAKRTILQYRREPVLTRARIGNAVMMGLLIGIVYFNQEDNVSSIQNKMGVSFIMIINQSISSMFGVVQEIPRDYAVFMREYLAGANRVSAYFSARTVSEIPFQVLFPMLFGSIVYWMVGMHPTADKFITFLFILVLTANTAVSLGYALSAIFKNSQASIAAGAVLLMPMALFSGLLLDLANLPNFLWPLQFLSIIKYGFHAIMINEYGNQPITCGGQLICSFRNGDAVLAYVGASADELGFNMGMLILFLVFFRVVAYIALDYHSTRIHNM